MWFCSRWVGSLCLGLCFSAGALTALELQAKRGSDDDLAITGPFASIPAGETRYVTRAELAGLAGFTKLHEKILPSFPEAELGVLPLSALLAVLPPGEGMDGLVLVCSDRWQSVLPLSFIKSYDPFLLIYYEGRTPDQGWPRFSAVEAFAPYFVSVSSAAHPDFNGVIDEGMISATQLVEIRAVNVQQHYAPFYDGVLATLGEKAAVGRKIFIRECNNCHEGPGGVGGNTSQRPLMLLQTHAALNEDFFRKMVRRPKDIYPNTVMPPHEYFTEETFTALIAFLRETRERMPPPSVP
jgi:cytochrome c2